MKRLCLLSLALVMLLSLTGCGKHSSSYMAVGLVRTNGSHSAQMSFYSLDGKMVFKMKSSGEGDVRFLGKLESGNATVYYEYRGTKSELFTIGPGEEVDSHGGYIESGTVYVIVETDGKCVNGSFSFDVE